MSKILLLEDDANLNDTVTEFLEEKGYDVVSVYDDMKHKRNFMRVSMIYYF